MSKHNFIGEMQCYLSDIFTSKSKSVTKNIEHHAGQFRGTLTVTVEEMMESIDLIRWQFSGRGLDKKDLLGKSDPFLIISRSNENGDYFPVCKTEVIKKTLDPDWAMFSTSTQTLCNGDYKRPLLFECYDWNKGGKHDFIGYFKKLEMVERISSNNEKATELE